MSRRPQCHPLRFFHVARIQPSFLQTVAVLKCPVRGRFHVVFRERGRTRQGAFGIYRSHFEMPGASPVTRDYDRTRPGKTKWPRHNLSDRTSGLLCSDFSDGRCQQNNCRITPTSLRRAGQATLMASGATGQHVAVGEFRTLSEIGGLVSRVYRPSGRRPSTRARGDHRYDRWLRPSHISAAMSMQGKRPALTSILPYL